MQGRTANEQRTTDALTLKSLGGNLQPAGKLSRPSWLETLKRLPLSFEPNQGQMDPRVRFVSRGKAYTLFLTSTEAVLVLRQGAGHGNDAGMAVPVVARMRLAGANPAPHLAGRDELLGKSNYFLGNDPSQWHTGIPNYGRIMAAEVYPGIDLVYHGNQGQLEYDFEVAPHADPRKIRFVLEGIQGLRADSRGDLLVKVTGGELRFRQPVAYQKTGGVERPVPVRYVLEGKNQVAFRLARYDTRQPLLIDPVLAYSTYLGGSGIDSANGIAVAPDGTAFIAGGTFSDDFPTEHALQPNAGGPPDFPKDAFVAKISADGSTLLYSTYLGGKEQDVANAIAVDAAGEAFVTGTTNSPDFPVAYAFDLLCGGDGKCGATWNTTGATVVNAFVTKLNVAGSALVYSSFLGYYENVQGLGIAVDGAENAYVTGEVGANITPTVSITPPATPPPPFPIVGGFQTTFGGSGTDAFITKIDATASEILYSSYLGGSDEDVGYGIAVDSSANAYLTGLTYSSNFPLSATPLQTAYAGAGDAYFTKVNTKATGAASLVYSTYLGGSGLDEGKGVAVDASDNAYVAGGTTSIASSLGFTPPAGAFQTDCALDTLSVCEGDAMVAKFNPTLGGAASLLYFTYLGGSLADSAAGIAVDTSGDVYVTGSTVSPNFPIAGTVFQPAFGGGNADAFVTELNPAGAGLVYSTFLGGSNTDTGAGIAVDTHGGAYVTGQTCSTDFPTHLPEQPAPGGNCDAFVSKVVVGPDISISPTSLTFPAQGLGTASTPQTITLTSDGDSPLVLGSVTISGQFAIQSDGCSGQTLTPPPGSPSTCSISVSFAPTSSGPQSGTLTIPDNVPGSPQTVNLNGLVTNVFVTPAQLNFGNQLVGTTSNPPLTVTLSSDSGSTLTISTISTSGDFAQDLALSTCGGSLATGSTCAIAVNFAPTAQGTRSGTLTITDNNSSSPQTVALTGYGDAPVVRLSTSILNFGTQTLGIAGSTLPVTLTNVGDGALQIGNISISSPFVETDSCPATPGSLAPNASCTIKVTFNPTAAGNFTGQLVFTDTAAGSPQSVSLSGTAVVPTVSLSATSLAFTGQLVGTTSVPQVVTFTNTSTNTAFLSITSIVVSGDFAVASGCGGTLAAGSSCPLNVTFTPTAGGTRTGAVTITDNAGNSPQTISLNGTGLAPAVSLAPTSLTFTGTSTWVTTPAQAVVLTNTGNASLTFTGAPTITGVNASEFLISSNTCPATLAAGANCAISITFTPSATGTQLAALSIADNAPDSPQTVGLTGLAPAVSVSPTSLTFGSTAVGATTAAQTVTLTNSGSAALLISSIAASGDFAATNNCGASVLAPPNSNSCTISVTFTPTATGNRYGTLTLTDSAANSPQTVPLAGTGAAAPTVALAPTSLTFADQPVNTTSNAQSVMLTNSGGASLTITSITVAGLNSSDFAVSQNTCPPTLAASAGCAFAVTFTPTAAGGRLASVSIVDNASNSPQSLPLSGTGILLPSVTLNPTSLTFGTEPVGTTSAPQTVTLTNSGGAALNIATIATVGDFAIASNPCGASLVAGASCPISITFTPTAPGTRSGSLIITDNATNSPQSATLVGGATAAPAVTLSPTSLTFPSESPGVTSPAQTVTLSNTGTASLTITSIAITGPFAENTTCGTSLPTSASCSINVTFTPTVVGTSTGTLTITDNAPGSPHTVTLGGAGSDFSLVSSPASVTVYAGTTADYNLTLTPKFGFNTKIALTCGGAPSQASCQIKPATFTLDGTNPATATLSVATTARVSAWPRGGTKLIPPLARLLAPLPLGVWLFVLVMLTGLLLANRRRRAVLILAFALCCVFLWGACGGGGTLSGVPSGTPAGTYTLTVTATSGAISHNISVTLTVN